MIDRPDTLDRGAAIAIGLWAVVGSAAVVLLGRALSGAFDRPIGPAVPFLATGVSLGLSVTAWHLFHARGQRGDVARRLVDGLFAILPASLIGYSTAVQASPSTLAAVTGLLVLGLVVLVAREGTRSHGHTAIAQTGTPSNESTEHHRASTTSGLRDGNDPPGDDAIDTADTTDDEPVEDARVEAATGVNSLNELAEEQGGLPVQQVIRRRTADGDEEIEALLHAVFSVGERQVALHLPIHPVLRATPDVECEPVDDTPISLRVAEVRPYGVRIEVQRSEGLDTAAQIPVSVLIRAVAASSSAA